MTDFLNKWQDLAGSVIGAATPITFWFIVKWIEARNEKKDNLYFSEKILVEQINAAVEANNTLKKFIKEKIPALVSGILHYDSLDKYATPAAFLPLFSLNPIDDRILSLKTGSGYLDNKLVEVLSMSKDFPLMIEDIRRQFQYTIERNQNFALKNINPSKIHNQQLITNLNEFAKVTQEEILDNNIPIYLRKLATALVAIRELRRMGTWVWQLKFSSRYKIFKNSKVKEEYEKCTIDRIDKFLKGKVDECIASEIKPNLN